MRECCPKGATTARTETETRKDGQAGHLERLSHVVGCSIWAGHVVHQRGRAVPGDSVPAAPNQPTYLWRGASSWHRSTPRPGPLRASIPGHWLLRAPVPWLAPAARERQPPPPLPLPLTSSTAHAHASPQHSDCQPLQLCAVPACKLHPRRAVLSVARANAHAAVACATAPIVARFTIGPPRLKHVFDCAHAPSAHFPHGRAYCAR